MKQAWLAELYRQWRDARGLKITPRQRAFRRKWSALLEAAGLHSAEDQQAALREAELVAKRGHIQLHRVPSRSYLVETIELPLASESWLRKLFNQREPTEALQESLAEIAVARALKHERFPKLWEEWCDALETAFRSGRNARPLYWRAPENVKSTLTLIHRLTSMEWRKGALVREVSIELGLDSKDLEKLRRGVEACLGQMFGRPMPLPSLGIVLTDSRSDLAGILTLHFPDGGIQIFDKLRAVFGLSLSDLERAERATTPAQRLLTVENSKTTLRRLASVNGDGSTLLAACSFPTKALLRLLQLLPSELSVFHFGDTDPAGYHILSKLREESGRTVVPFLMCKRPANKKRPLGEYDEALLPGLIRHPLLQDVVSQLEAMKRSGCKGDFEQETIGMPDLETWPFFSASLGKVT